MSAAVVDPSARPRRERQQPVEHEVGLETSIVEGTFTLIQAGELSVGVTRLKSGKLKAVRNWCPHKGAPLCRTKLTGTWLPSAPGELAYGREGEVLVCPWHGFEWSIDDGRELYRDIPTRLRFYPVTVRDGTVYVQV